MPALPLPPSCSARFHAERLLATGGFGAVWLARQVDLDRPAAIKVLTAEALRRPTSVRRFLAEARITAGLDHPAIVVVYDFGGETEIPWIAYEYVPGLTLRQRMSAGALSWREALDVTAQLLEGVGAAHQAGVLHRDIKPENVLTDAEGRPKLTDFGVAYVDEERSFETMAGTVVGTPTYIAPEVARGGEAGPASDLYACAVMLFELLTGRPPFHAPTIAQILEMHVRAPAPAASTTRPELPRELDQVLERGLAKDPAARHPDAHAFGAELREILAAHAFSLQLAPTLSGQVVPAGDPPRTPPAPARTASPRLHPALAAAGALLLAVDVLLQGWTGARARPPAPDACVEFAPLAAELATRTAELHDTAAVLQRIEGGLVDPARFEVKELARLAGPAEPSACAVADEAADLAARIGQHAARRHGSVAAAGRAEQEAQVRAAGLAFASWGVRAQARRVCTQARWCGEHAAMLDDLQRLPSVTPPVEAGLALLRTWTDALLAALARVAESGRLTPGLLDVVDETGAVAEGLLVVHWPEADVARARAEFDRALETARALPGALAPDLADAVLGAWSAHVPGARSQAALARGVAALARIAALDPALAAPALKLRDRLARRVAHQ